MTKIFKLLIIGLISSLFVIGCSSDEGIDPPIDTMEDVMDAMDDDTVEVDPEAGSLDGEPFEFLVDGTSDFVSNITVTGNVIGTHNTFVIVDEDGYIVVIPEL